jgi:DNA polymerase I
MNPLDVIGWDFETERFANGYRAPRPVCMTWAQGDRQGLAVTAEILQSVQYALRPGQLSCGFNIAYDLGCSVAWLPVRELVCDAFDRLQIIDCGVVERLACTFQGTEYFGASFDVLGQKYGLQSMTGKADKKRKKAKALAHYSEDMDPDELIEEEPESDAIQTSYGPLLGAPLSAYSQEQIDYAIGDAVNTRKLFLRQYERWIRPGKVDLADAADFTRRAFWLHLMHCRGLRTDIRSIEELRAVTQAEVDHYLLEFRKLGFFKRGGSKDTKTIKAWVTKAYDGNPPMTKESAKKKREREAKRKLNPCTPDFVPSVSIARATLEGSGNIVLQDFAKYGETAAVLNKDLPMLAQGMFWPIHTRWGMAATCRTTSSAPNIQNFRRGAPKKCLHCGTICRAQDKACGKCGATGKTSFHGLMGIRECIIPREGYCFVAIDHSQLELVALAQVIVKMLGLRRMADRINGGFDLHSDVGCLLAGESYDTFRARFKSGDELAFIQRNCGKVYQFGRHGGMGAETLSYYAKQGYGLDLSVERAQELIRIGARANPDGAEYLKAVSRVYPKDADGRFVVKAYGGNVTRGGCTYSAAANHPFQYLGARIESLVGWEMAREQLTGFTRDGKRSPLGECFGVNHVHDEFISEVPIHLAHDVIERKMFLMTEVPKRLLPDVILKAEAVAMDRWSKKAKLVTEPDGRFGIWHYEAA